MLAPSDVYQNLDLGHTAREFDEYELISDAAILMK